MQTETRTRPLLRHPAVRFVLHYAEMCVAMIVGMYALGALWDVAWPSLTDRADVAALVMAADMAIGMAAWMKIRGHAARPILEMSVAMVAPFVVLLVPYWFGVVSAGTVMMFGHVLMFVTMAVAMLVRRDEYTGSHHH